ncbi:MAG TPA: hypothetical protein ENG38_00910 [Thermoplasmatales archaeon]|nr:hypothetical protein [Thermoplasmatales archaeon]HEX08352.1 hypothetical protein [Thermoplasmatales archaeon]
MEEAVKIKNLVSLLYILSGIAMLLASIVIYYYKLPFTGSGWSIKNHRYWYLFVLSWIFSILTLLIGLVTMIKTKFKKKLREVPVFSTIQKMKLKCKKCGHIFEILVPALDKEYKCPKCGEIGRIEVQSKI